MSEVGVEVFGDPLDTARFPAPEVIWKAWKRPASKQWDYIEQFVEVIAGPNDVLRRPLKTGDILVRVALGEPGLGHLALIADPRLWRREELAGAGLTPEGRRPGKYVQVVEGGFRPHSRWEGFARRLLDNEGRLPNNQMILRLIINMAPETTEQVTTSPVTSGEFGMALNKYGEMPNDVIDLLKFSPTFVKMVKNLDGLYVDIWNTARTTHRPDVVRNFSAGVVTLGTLKTAGAQYKFK